jgi:hypothetical protein
LIEDAVPAEHAVDVGFDELFEKKEVALSLVFGESDERGKGARNSYDAENFWAGPRLELALVAEQESEAESLVEDSRERVRRIEGYGGEERVDLLLEKLDGELAVGLAEVLPAEDRDAGALEFGDEAVVPAGGLVVVELVEAIADALHSLMLGESPSVKVMGKVEAVFEALQDAGNADLDELIEVAGGDGEKFDSLE